MNLYHITATFNGGVVYKRFVLAETQLQATIKFTNIFGNNSYDLHCELMTVVDNLIQ